MHVFSYEMRLDLYTPAPSLQGSGSAQGRGCVGQAGFLLRVANEDSWGSELLDVLLLAETLLISGSPSESLLQ